MFGRVLNTPLNSGLLLFSLFLTLPKVLKVCVLVCVEKTSNSNGAKVISSMIIIVAKVFFDTTVWYSGSRPVWLPYRSSKTKNSYLMSYWNKLSIETKAWRLKIPFFYFRVTSRRIKYGKFLTKTQSIINCCRNMELFVNIVKNFYEQYGII